MWRRDQNVEIRREKEEEEEKGKKQNSKLGIKYLKSFINIETKKKTKKKWPIKKLRKALGHGGEGESFM